MSEIFNSKRMANELGMALGYTPDRDALAKVRRDALNGPRHPDSIDAIFRFVPHQLGTAGTTDADVEAVLLRFDFADQARYAHERGDEAGADALMRLANEITPETVQFMAVQDLNALPLHRDERIPGFVAANFTGGRGDVHNPGSRFETTALSQVEVPTFLARKIGEPHD
jgi:hypothetical protein